MTHRSDVLLGISSIDWDFIWQGHQEIMSTLAARRPSRAVPREHRRPRAEGRAICRACASASATGGAAPRGSARSGRTCSSTRRWCCRCRIRASRAGSTGGCCCARCAAGCAPPGSPADRLDVPADAAGARSDRRARSAADDLLLHRRPRVELAGGAPHRRERATAVPRGRPRCSSPPRSCASAPREFSERVHLFPFGVNFERVRATRAQRRAAAGRHRRRCRGRSSATSAACISGWIRSWSRPSPRGCPSAFALVGPAQTDVSRSSGVQQYATEPSKRHSWRG